jgi:predicted O-methyltransferase YrrM
MGIALHHNPPGIRPRRVFLAIPAYESPGGLLAFSLFRAHVDLQSAGFDVELQLLIGDCHVDDARNSLVHDFLASSCDDLVFLDADIGFQSADLIRILNHDRDVVGGVYPKKSDIDQYPAWLPDGPRWSDKDGLLEAIGFCTGFMRIRRAVLEKMAAESPEYIAAGGAKIREVFRREIIDGVRNSGDIAFCRRWRAMGGKVFVDPSCYLEHRGQKTWAGTLGSYLRRQSGIELVAGISRIKEGKERDSDYFELMLEWGNDPWAASPELMKTCVMVARQVKGCVLETGSGITTLLMAAANPDLTIHSLEHKADWAARLEQAAHKLDLKNIVIHRVDLKDYPAGKWYDVPRLPWNEFNLVLCDGPPRREGNRRTLFGVMATHDCRPRCVLVDDADTEGDSIPSEYQTEIKGQLRKFAVGLRKASGDR